MNNSPHCCTRTACSAQTYNNSASVLEDNAQSLFGWDRFVNWIGVTEVVAEFDFVRFAARREFFANERWIGDCFFEYSHHFVARFQCAFFVIVTCKVVAAISCPVIFENFFYTFVGMFHDRKPCESCPHSIFFTNMIRSSSVKINDEIEFQLKMFEINRLRTQNFLRRTSTIDSRPSNYQNISIQSALRSILFSIWLRPNQQPMRLACSERIR